MRTRHALTDRWHIKQLEPGTAEPAELTRHAADPDETWLPAAMPAQVHEVLLAHGKIPDPHIGKNAAECVWVGEADWAYACRFPTPPEAADTAPVWLRFLGLDTLAKAYLNGQLIGAFKNMFREYAVEVSGVLSAPGGENLLLIVFASPLKFLEDLTVPAGLEGTFAHKKYIRKPADDFNSYLGARPHFAKIGVYRDVVLDIPEKGWLEDVLIRSELAEDSSRATVNISATWGGQCDRIAWTVTDPDGVEISQGERAGRGQKIKIEAVLDSPKLWWPRTHGTPHLYRLSVSLLSDGREVDRQESNFGIRRIAPVLFDPKTGEKRFGFQINGRMIFLKGADWAPLEGISHCWDNERAMGLLALAERADMNVFRVWGGGCFPPESFYQECDRRGLLVWQDFMFNYGMYPSGVDEIDEQCRAEVAEAVRRLRNHPCIFLWCGGNENHMGWDFAHDGMPTVGRDLFEKIMAEACAENDPTRLYHPSSPFGGPVPNWPLAGDWHDYSTVKFSPHASVPTFVTETGRVSTPSLGSMKKFLSEQELWPAGHDAAIRRPGQPAWPEMWGYRAADGAWDKIGPIEEFCEASSPGDLIRALGTAHGEYLRRRIERQRRGVPDGAPDGGRRCWGSMVWRLNDPWPINYWSVIDYYLQPKIAYFFLKRAYEPVLVCFERDDDRICVWVVNDSTESVSGELLLRRLRFGGDSRGELRVMVDIPPGESKRCLDATGLGPIYLRKEYLSASFAGREVTQLLTGERYLYLPEAGLEIRPVDGGVEVAARAFARQVRLSIDGENEGAFADNFFDLSPGQKRRIQTYDIAAGRRIIAEAVNAEPVETCL